MFWEILKTSKGLPVTNQYAALWGKKIAEAGSWKVTEITGELPLIFLSDGSVLVDYRIYGTSAGAGVETGNLVDKDNLNIVKAYINSNDTIVSHNTNGLIYVPVVTGETYTISGFKRSSSATVVKWGITASIPTNNVSCTRVGLLNQSSSITVTITSGEAYLCIFLCGDSEYSRYGSVEQAVMKNAETGMIIPGSTAPTTYIPYGYKIPILNTSGVTENICNGTELVGDGTSKRLYFDKDKILSSTSRLYVSINSGSTQLSNASVYLNSTYKRAISGSNTFTFNVYLTAQDISDIKESKAPYIRIYKSNTYMTAISEEMITLATPPDHYIPHRYTSNYDLFIGSTKLGEEEYVDYQEQKVYKRTENLAFAWLQNCSIGASGTISANNVYGLAVAHVEAGQTYAMRVDYDSSISTAIVYAYYTEMPQIGSVSYDGSCNGVTAPTQVFTAPITGYVAVWCVYGRDTIVHSGTVPESYIPYLQPTDPPVPLPPIPTYKDENTLSSTETLGEVTVKGRIKEVDS